MPLFETSVNTVAVSLEHVMGNVIFVELTSMPGIVRFRYASVYASVDVTLTECHIKTLWERYETKNNKRNVQYKITYF